jgi:hypothetical protein
MPMLSDVLRKRCVTSGKSHGHYFLYYLYLYIYTFFLLSSEQVIILSSLHTRTHTHNPNIRNWETFQDYFNYPTAYSSLYLEYP